MNIDPSTTKYLIQARLEAEGIVEKPDVVGAVFGQTEGLLGEELDLRDLQKSGRIGRIEVDVQSKKGRSEGTILIPSSLDQVETSILAAALETIDRVGPCKATIKVDKVEDTRVTKRNKIIERARSLLSSMVEESKTSGSDLLDEVRQSVQVSEIVSFGAERLPAGPNVADSDAIIIVGGRQDVLNLLRSGIKNAIAVEGTNVPKTIQELSKERALTAFVDGDRGGDLILKELLQVAEVDFIARAPRGKEVEELTQKQIMKCLRNKIPADQYVEMYGLSGQVYKAESEFPEPKPAGGPQPRAEPRPEFRPELGPRLGPGLRSTRRLRFGELRLRLVDLAREAVHLDVLVRGDLVPQALHDLLLGELFDFLAPRGAGDEVDLCHLEEFLQDQVATAVPIDECGERPLFRELLDRLRDVRPFDRDRVLDPRPEEVQDILAPLDDDDRVAVGDVRSGGKPLGPERHDLRHLHALAYLVEEVRPGGLRLLDHGREQGAGSLDDLVPLGHAGVLDLVDLDCGLARADAVDRLEGRRQDRGLDLVQRGRD